MFLKKVFFASASILMLALAYHLGAQSATAQGTQTIAGFSGSGSHCSGVFYVMTSNGDVYGSAMAGGPCGTGQSVPDYIGNFWGVTTRAATQSFGSLKVKYR